MTTQPEPGIPPDPPEPRTLSAAAGRSDALHAHRVRRTRMGGIWVAAALFAVVLLLLLIFILENGQHVSITFFGAGGHLPLGVALLLAAVLGVLLVVIPGTGRIIQLRHTARRHRRLDVAAATPPVPAAGQADPGPDRP